MNNAIYPLVRGLGSTSSILLGLALVATSATAAKVDLDKTWVRWLPGDLPLGGYFRLHNGSDHAIQLTGVKAPDFKKAMLHNSIEENGIDKMVHVDARKIAAGETIEFAPGGYHVMLMHRRHDIEQGSNIPITLLFADHAPMKATFPVRSATGE